jgi:hypothetical protein
MACLRTPGLPVPSQSLPAVWVAFFLPHGGVNASPVFPGAVLPLSGETPLVLHVSCSRFPRVVSAALSNLLHSFRHAFNCTGLAGS